MAKISTYGIVPSPASMGDLLIGTDISSANATKNFEISQIMSLFNESAARGVFTSTTNQTLTGPNSANIISFDTAINNNNIVLTNSTTLTVNAENNYLITLMLNAVAGSSIDCVNWLKVNGSNVGHGQRATLVTGNNTINISWLLNIQEGSTLQAYASISSVSGVVLTTQSSGLFSPIMGARLVISQI